MKHLEAHRYVATKFSQAAWEMLTWWHDVAASQVGDCSSAADDDIGVPVSQYK